MSAFASVLNDMTQNKNWMKNNNLFSVLYLMLHTDVSLCVYIGHIYGHTYRLEKRSIASLTEQDF